MSRRKAGSCFYCCRQLFRDPKGVRRGGGSLPADAYTVDHVIPQSAMWRYAKWSIEQCNLNKVACCPVCNNRKGNMPPVYWLEMIRSDRQQALRDLLDKLPLTTR